MFKKIITASLLLVASTMANATLIDPPIEGGFNISGNAEVTLDATGKITSFGMHNIELSTVSGDFRQFIPTSPYAVNFGSATPLSFDIATLLFDRIVDFGGLTFNPLRVRFNETDHKNDTTLSLVGILSADGYADTETEWRFTTQGLINNGTIVRSYSGYIEAPIKKVPEPGSMAIFCLAIAGSIISRKKSLKKQL